MNLNSEQPRQPIGIPSGGQWAEKRRQDSGVTLGDLPVRPASGLPSALDVIQLPDAQRGEKLKRVEALQRALEAITNLNAIPDDNLGETVVKFGGKTSAQGGAFRPASKGPRPRRVRGQSFAERQAIVQEYNSRPTFSEITVNDRSKFGGGSLSEQANILIHEIGHRIDWKPGENIPGLLGGSVHQKFYSSSSSQRVSGDVSDQDEAIRNEFRALAEEAKNSESVLDVRSRAGSSPGFYRYFTSTVEVWARAYNQWVVDKSGDPFLREHMDQQIAEKRQFTNEEMTRIGPIVENILRLRGLVE